MSDARLAIVAPIVRERIAQRGFCYARVPDSHLRSRLCEDADRIEAAMGSEADVIALRRAALDLQHATLAS